MNGWSRAGAGHLQDLHGAAGVERGAADHVEELLLADQAGARAGQQDAAGLDHAIASLFMSLYFFSAVITCSRSRVSLAGSRITTSNCSPRVAASRRYGNRSACTNLIFALLSCAFFLAISRIVFVEVDADHFLGVAAGLGVDREAAGVAADVQHALALGEARTGIRGCRAGRRRSRSCGRCRGWRGTSAPYSVMTLGAGGIRARGSRSFPASARALRRSCRNGSRGSYSFKAFVDPLAMAERAGREELDHQQVAVAVHDQPGQAVAFGMHHAPGVGDLVELQHVAAQGDGGADLAREEGLRRSASSKSSVSTRSAMREWPL